MAEVCRPGRVKITPSRRHPSVLSGGNLVADKRTHFDGCRTFERVEGQLVGLSRRVLFSAALPRWFVCFLLVAQGGLRRQLLWTQVLENSRCLQIGLVWGRGRVEG